MYFVYWNIFSPRAADITLYLNILINYYDKKEKKTAARVMIEIPLFFIYYSCLIKASYQHPARPNFSRNSGGTKKKFDFSFLPTDQHQMVRKKELGLDPPSL